MNAMRLQTIGGQNEHKINHYEKTSTNYYHYVPFLGKMQTPPNKKIEEIFKVKLMK